MQKIMKQSLSVWALAALLAGVLPTAVVLALDASSCCKPGAACCVPGSPCCAGHHHPPAR